MSSDTLTISSRAFYERTKIKMVASILVAALGLMLLGFASTAGGNAQSNNLLQQRTITDDNVKQSFQALTGGYGFATFVYLLAFILFIAGAVYVSPAFCGSGNEKKMIRSPQELDSGNYAAYSEKSSATQV
uniref:Uncharacterized protein n=1 Tax=Chromulina nebulosa TaxID=96789 RepID=A0A7S0SSU5_9STRA|mmetsp:Transcript_3095/g.2741  ORF Transcript_3095/g.2741 Transcript_3095/m.2741 type:complete len:131 (+) Transcript_3095:53-445(+)